jgi:hypothetical protein
MTTLESGFKRQLREALLDDVEAAFVADDGPVWGAVERSHDILREYGRRNDYDVGPIIEALSEPAITRTERSVRAYWGWFHPAAPHFEFGSSDHTVNGDSVLSFIWEDAPPEIHEMFPDTQRKDGDPRVFFPSVEVAGLPESRFVRKGLAWLRREVA